MSEWNWKQASFDFAAKTLRYVAAVACVGLLSFAIVLSVLIVKAGDAAEPDMVLGLIDRMEAAQDKQRAHELSTIHAMQRDVDAQLAGEIDYEVDLRYCMTQDWERIQFDKDDYESPNLESLWSPD